MKIYLTKSKHFKIYWKFFEIFSRLINHLIDWERLRSCFPVQKLDRINFFVAQFSCFLNSNDNKNSWVLVTCSFADNSIFIIIHKDHDYLMVVLQKRVENKLLRRFVCWFEYSVNEKTPRDRLFSWGNFSMYALLMAFGRESFHRGVWNRARVPWSTVVFQKQTRVSFDPALALRSYVSLYINKYMYTCGFTLEPFISAFCHWRCARGRFCAGSRVSAKWLTPGSTMRVILSRFCSGSHLRNVPTIFTTLSLYALKFTQLINCTV